MTTLLDQPIEHKPTTGDLEHISTILPGVLASIVEAAQLHAQQNQTTPEPRSVLLRWAA
jgi:hypothetical protein